MFSTRIEGYSHSSMCRHPSVLKGLGRLGKSKVEMWDDLKLLSWSRTLSATWLVGILDLLLRVQLNILGRHLFVQQQWYPPPPLPHFRSVAAGTAQHPGLTYFCVAAMVPPPPPSLPD
jgi:hypothetical protein